MPARVTRCVLKRAIVSKRAPRWLYRARAAHRRELPCGAELIRAIRTTVVYLVRFVPGIAVLPILAHYRNVSRSTKTLLLENSSRR